MLFGKPWVHENNASYDNVDNIYSFEYNGRKIKLLAMNPAQILDIELAKEQTKKMDAIKNDLSNSNDACLAEIKHHDTQPMYVSFY